MKNDKESVIIVLVFFCILILLSLSHCETIQRREADWRSWTDDAEELGYSRGYENGYDEGYSDGYQDAMNTIE